jgi:hypothetical protein
VAVAVAVAAEAAVWRWCMEAVAVMGPAEVVKEVALALGCW